MAKQQGKSGDDGLTDDSLLDDGLEADGELIDTEISEGDEPKGEEKIEDKVDERQGEDEIQVEIESEVEAREGKDDEVVEDDRDDKDGEREEPDDKSEYGKKVHARIERERRIAREARSTADAERALRIKAQREALDAKKEALEISEAGLKAQIEMTKVALVKAKDDGKTTEEVDLQYKLHDQQARLARVEAAKGQLATEEEEIKKGAEAARPNPLAEEWKRRNPWFGNPRYKEQGRIALMIDQTLAEEGFDKTTVDYYRELDKRLRTRCPELQRFSRKPQDHGRQGRKSEQRRDPTGGVPRGGGASAGGATKPGKVVLTAADLESMRAFGLDPKNKEHLQEYARNKMNGGR